MGTDRIFVWTDIETTGLDDRVDVILEIACAVAPKSDPFKAEFVFDGAIGYPWLDVYKLRADPFVAEMHTKNGLWYECAASTRRRHDVEAELLRALPDTGPASLIMAGNSVHFDLAFIRWHMPELAKRFHHRVFDVSAAWMFLEACGMPPHAKLPPAHRARGDVLQSIEFARKLRDWASGTDNLPY